MSALRIAVLASGGGSNLQAIIDASESGDLKSEVALIIANRKAAFALERGKNHNIRSEYVGIGNYPEESDRNKKILSLMDEENIDFVVLAGYLSILDIELVKKYKDRIINIHPSLIPSFCGHGFYGIKVHEKAIERGVKFSGATVHYVDEGTDTGPILNQEVVPVYMDDTAEILQKKIIDIEHRLLVSSIKAIEEDRVVFKNGKAYIVDKQINGEWKMENGE